MNTVCILAQNNLHVCTWSRAGRVCISDEFSVRGYVHFKLKYKVINWPGKGENILRVR